MWDLLPLKVQAWLEEHGYKSENFIDGYPSQTSLIVTITKGPYLHSEHFDAETGEHIGSDLDLKEE